MRRLADLHREGWAALQAARHLQRTEYVHARDLPAADQPPDVAFPGARRTAIDSGRRCSAASRSSGSSRSGAVARTIGSRSSNPPADRFYADPFLAEHDGRTFVFFEDYSYVDAQGHDRLRRAPRRTASASRTRCSPARITCRIPRSSSGAASGSCCRKPARDGEWRSGARAGSPTNGSSRPSP